MRRLLPKPIKYARKCSVTGKGMNDGWYFENTDYYVKYEADALKYAISLGYNTLRSAYNDEACYWTEWDEKNDAMYEMINGELKEI